MSDYADLEVGLHDQDANSYRVEARLNMPGQDARRERLATVPRFDLDDLGAVASDPDAYGKKLTTALFAKERLRSFLDSARASAATQDAPLRLRLNVGPSLPGLHDLRWETLRDPYESDLRLATDENVLFSRYLGSEDWRPVRPRPRGELRALVAIANPANLADLQPRGRLLASVDVEGEIERARTGLAGYELTALASGGRATLRQIIAHLGDGYEVFYLVCHGAVHNGKPQLWLEDEAGNGDVVEASELVTRMRGMRERPRLVVLASCQSAGDGKQWTSTDEGALSALGPRLAEIGVPAVVAMQGNVSMETVTQFMPVFFKELQVDGQIDRAMAVARRDVWDRPDWWVPVLFTRLESGQLFVPTASAAATGDEPEPEDDMAEAELEAQAAGGEDTGGYNVRAVRDLLEAGFSADGLRQLLFYSGNPELQRVVRQFGSGDGLTARVEKAIAHCVKYGLLPDLLAEVKRENPRQYARFEPQLRL